MAFVMNASVEPIKVRVYGKYFKFKPGQIKNLQPHFADMMTIDKGYLGFVRLSDKFEDFDYKASKDGKSEIEAKKAEGISRRVNYLQGLVRNELQSLPEDLLTKNSKIDPRLMMNDGMISNMKELKKYKASTEKQEEKRVDEIKELEESLGLDGLAPEA